MRLLIVLPLCFLTGCTTISVKGVISGAELVEFGIYEGNRGDGYTLVRETDRIPFVEGVVFGVTVRINGEPEGEYVRVRDKWIRERMTIHKKRLRGRSWGYVVKLGEEWKSLQKVQGDFPSRLTVSLGAKDFPLLLKKNFWVVEVEDK